MSSGKETLMVRSAVLPGLYTLSPARPTASRVDAPLVLDDSSLKSSSARLGFGGSASMPGVGATGALDSPSKRGKPYKGHPTESSFDERTVAFKGYYNESVADSATETWRSRHLFIKFFLGDSTAEVNEVENELTRNDGIMHGKFLRRSHLPGLDRTNFQEVLRVGSTVELYGRKVMLYACDDATRSFFEALGVEQPDNFEPVMDSYTEATLKAHKPAEGWYGTRTSSITRFLEASRGSQRDFSDTKARAMKHDGQNLLFLLLWRFEEDGKPAQFKYWMQYYLSSQEVEISEVPGQRNHLSLLRLLKRRRLPRTVLAHDDRSRSCEAFEYEHDYYHAEDLLVGATINVFGRPMLICDVDDKTQEWYAREMGHDQRAARYEIPEEVAVKVEVAVPPHTGIGSEEDTLNSLKSLVPKPPRKDFSGRTGFYSRWRASLVSRDPIDRMRDFRVMYYSDDKEVAVYEPAVRNSGISGGLFMKRMRLRNPATGEFYRVEDFVVGSTVVINAFSFNLLEHDMAGCNGPDAPSPAWSSEAAATAAKAAADAGFGAGGGRGSGRK